MWLILDQLVEDELRLRSHLFRLTFWVIKDWYRKQTVRRPSRDSGDTVSDSYEPSTTTLQVAPVTFGYAFQFDTYRV